MSIDYHRYLIFINRLEASRRIPVKEPKPVISLGMHPKQPLMIQFLRGLAIPWSPWFCSCQLDRTYLPHVFRAQQKHWNPLQVQSQGCSDLCSTRAEAALETLTCEDQPQGQVWEEIWESHSALSKRLDSFELLSSAEGDPFFLPIWRWIQMEPSNIFKPKWKMISKLGGLIFGHSIAAAH